MATAPLQLDDNALEEKIEDLLLRKQYRVLELLQELGDQGIGDSQVKEALAHLLHDNRIELTPNRYLHSLAVPA